MKHYAHRNILIFTFLSLLFAVHSNHAGDKKTYWIDVRSAGEFEKRHHPEAVNIPHKEIGERISEVTDSKDADIRVYCRSGRRSGIAKETLEKLGFSQVTNEGGINDVLSE